MQLAADRAARKLPAVQLDVVLRGIRKDRARELFRDDRGSFEGLSEETRIQLVRHRTVHSGRAGVQMRRHHFPQIRGSDLEPDRLSVERHAAGAVGYFNALGSRSYGGDADRLDAHIGRLATIVRDFLPAGDPR